ncbi:hypothetical protein LguiA_021710 [Lonicera macranthoides]
MATTPSPPTIVSLLHRSQFPPGFTFGAASSSFQIEGAVDQDGRLPSIWDTYSEEHDLVTGDHSWRIAVDHYNRYEEDVKIMKEMGLDAYRFSISWSRILPKGNLAGGKNELGIAFYNNLINALLANGIEPFITLFHWDLPQALEDEYGGFRSRRIVEDFRDYAEVCFQEFGDRVKHWITLNEPWSFSYGGYALGTLAPGRGYFPTPPGRSHRSVQELLPPSPYSFPVPPGRGRSSAPVGDPGTEPYVVSHNQLLAHAYAVQLYRNKYQATQKGTIGIALVTIWTEPYRNTPEDIAAAERAQEFWFGWFMDPVTFGDYPASMKKMVGDRLPRFTKEESQLLKGSSEFLGLNYYTANYVEDAPDVGSPNGHYVTDPLVVYHTVRDGLNIGEPGGSAWLFVYPDGIHKLLTYVRKKYGNPLIHITENGLDEVNDPNLTLWEALFDHRRVAYHHDHLIKINTAIKEGSDVQGYFTWSILDNFEWASAFASRFGNTFVDYNNNLARYPKLSSGWLRFLLQK